MMELNEVRRAVEALLLVAEDPLSRTQLAGLLKEHDEDESNLSALVEQSLELIKADCSERAYELVEVGSGFRLQVRPEFNKWIGKLWMQRPRQYSRALLETLALIAYRQPITRGEIEQVRGVSVSSYTIRTLIDRGWIRELGAKDLPGRPMMYGTTRSFLDYFNLKTLDDLPPLHELQSPANDIVDSVTQ
ncbi:MAG: SMC-Scp complex subunit ScpB [Gammaproteobacteria bacterium]|nr:SMC-Scp complex subunit ScpB [Gammaproteobacteria bacterium]